MPTFTPKTPPTSVRLTSTSGALALAFAIALVALTVTARSHAQQPPSAAAPFPPNAEAAPAAMLKERLADKVFRVTLADGGGWRLDFRGNGYVYLDTATGFRDTGRWRTEDGKLCTEWKRVNSSCNAVTTAGEALYLKRDSGEVVELVVQK